MRSVGAFGGLDHCTRTTEEGDGVPARKLAPRCWPWLVALPALQSVRKLWLTAVPGGLLEIVAFLSCLLVFALWKRARYFGNWSALIPALLLPWWPGQFSPGSSIIWTLPFAFVFIGGMYADLLETSFFAGHFRRHVAATVVLLIGASFLFSVLVVAGA